MDIQQRTQEGFYALLHQRVQAYFTRNMGAQSAYTDILAILKTTAQECNYDYGDMNVLGAFKAYIQPKDPKENKNNIAPIKPQVSSTLAFDRKKVV
ncbi:hypothetical protein [Microscilla marina]|uniref:Uncharacterized protein n=1 Tax=Microscilla marina ATCC 23134 TaxID=313606 RepID=A1ZRX8_MICM2|nr:hypothetical protein [Microscilla marina]EAY26866.1 hypothetical protein M23134_04816 [Microscilla marina ATCC 23134]